MRELALPHSGVWHTSFQFMVVLLKHVLPHVSDKLLVIWDGSPIHKGPVRTFLAEGGAKYVH
jgi:hypothetical protein